MFCDPSPFFVTERLWLCNTIISTRFGCNKICFQKKHQLGKNWLKDSTFLRIFQRNRTLNLSIDILDPWARGGIKIWGGANKNLGGRISECYKSGGAPMVKIKDFTLASKNLGGGTCSPPRALYTSRQCLNLSPPTNIVYVLYKQYYQYSRSNSNRVVR